MATGNSRWTISRMRQYMKENPMSINAAPTPSASINHPIDKTLATAGTAEDLLTVPAGEIVRKVSIINRGPGAARVNFDAVATATVGVLLQDNESYADDGLAIGVNISFINVTGGKKPRVSGIAWGN